MLPTRQLAQELQKLEAGGNHLTDAWGLSSSFFFGVPGVHHWPVVCSHTIGLVPKSTQQLLGGETETSRLDLQQLSKLSQVSLEAKT